jgi:hypothetical protein
VTEEGEERKDVMLSYDGNHRASSSLLLPLSAKNITVSKSSSSSSSSSSSTSSSSSSSSHHHRLMMIKAMLGDLFLM